MKSRAIEDTIRSMGFEKGTVHVLQTINEDLQSQRKDLQELGMEFLKMIELVDQLANVSSVMKDRIEKLGKEPEDDGLDPNTQGLN